MDIYTTTSPQSSPIPTNSALDAFMPTNDFSSTRTLSGYLFTPPSSPSPAGEPLVLASAVSGNIALTSVNYSQRSQLMVSRSLNDISTAVLSGRPEPLRAYSSLDAPIFSSFEEPSENVQAPPTMFTTPPPSPPPDFPFLNSSSPLVFHPRRLDFSSIDLGTHSPTLLQPNPTTSPITPLLSPLYLSPLNSGKKRSITEESPGSPSSHSPSSAVLSRRSSSLTTYSRRNRSRPSSTTSSQSALSRSSSSRSILSRSNSSRSIQSKVGQTSTTALSSERDTKRRKISSEPEIGLSDIPVEIFYKILADVDPGDFQSLAGVGSSFRRAVLLNQLRETGILTSSESGQHTITLLQLPQLIALDEIAARTEPNSPQDASPQPTEPLPEWLVLALCSSAPVVDSEPIINFDLVVDIPFLLQYMHPLKALLQRSSHICNVKLFFPSQMHSLLFDDWEPDVEEFLAELSEHGCESLSLCDSPLFLSQKAPSLPEIFSTSPWGRNVRRRRPPTTRTKLFRRNLKWASVASILTTSDPATKWLTTLLNGCTSLWYLNLVDNVGHCYNGQRLLCQNLHLPNLRSIYITDEEYIDNIAGLLRSHPDVQSIDWSWPYPAVTSRFAPADPVTSNLQDLKITASNLPSFLSQVSLPCLKTVNLWVNDVFTYERAAVYRAFKALSLHERAHRIALGLTFSQPIFFKEQNPQLGDCPKVHKVTKLTTSFTSAAHDTLLSTEYFSVFLSTFPDLRSLHITFYGKHQVMEPNGDWCAALAAHCPHLWLIYSPWGTYQKDSFQSDGRWAKSPLGDSDVYFSLV